MVIFFIGFSYAQISTNAKLLATCTNKNQNLQYFDSQHTTYGYII